MNLFRRFVAAGALAAVATTGAVAMALPAHAATLSPSVLTTKISAVDIAKTLTTGESAVLVKQISPDQLAIIYTKDCLLGARPCPDLPQLPEPKCPVGPLTLCAPDGITFTSLQMRSLVKQGDVHIVDLTRYDRLRNLLKNFCVRHPEVCRGQEVTPKIPVPDPGPWFQLDEAAIREVNVDLAKAIVEVPQINIDRILIGL